MRKHLSMLLVVGFAASIAFADILLKQDGASRGPVIAINVIGGGLASSRDAGVGLISCAPASTASTGCVSLGGVQSFVGTKTIEGILLVDGGVDPLTSVIKASGGIDFNGRRGLVQMSSNYPAQIKSWTSAANVSTGSAPSGCFLPQVTLDANDTIFSFSATSNPSAWVWAIDKEGDSTQLGGVTTADSIAVGTNAWVGGSLFADAGIRLGGGGAYAKIVSYNSARDPTMDFDFSAGGITCQTLAIGVPGAALGDNTSLGLVGQLGEATGVLWDSWVCDAGACCVRGCDVTSSNVNPAPLAVTCDVWSH